MSAMPPNLPAGSTEVRTRRVSRRRAALSWSDRAALVSGVVIVLAILVWFSWRVSRNIARDLEVDARAVTPAGLH